MGQALRVMSANLWMGRADPEGVVDLIRRLQPDVVALQELGHEQAEWIAEELPYGVMTPGDLADGTGIALRNPARIDVVPSVFRSHYAARLEPRDWPALPGTTEILATHLAPPHLGPLGAGLRHRRHQLRELEGHLTGKPCRHRVLVGDLNATPAWPAYRRIAKRLPDAAVAVARARGDRPRKTWGPGPGSTRWLRLDHAFVQGLAAVDFQVIALPGSDHDAIVVDLCP